MSKSACPLCLGAAADAELDRIEVWQDAHWRLTVSLATEVPGFAYLESKRHVAAITDLTGDEARTFGVALATSTRALKEATGAAVVYVYIFGDSIPHLHVHLAPHRPGDALNDQMVRGTLTEEKLPSGMTRIVASDFPTVARMQLQEIAAVVRARLACGS